MRPLNVYHEAAAVVKLRAPCQDSCQKLIDHIYNTNDWQSMFDYQIILHGGGGAAGPSGSRIPTNAKAGSSPSPSTKGGAAHSMAGKNGAESGFQASIFKVLTPIYQMKDQTS